MIQGSNAFFTVPFLFDANLLLSLKVNLITNKKEIVQTWILGDDFTAINPENNTQVWLMLDETLTAKDLSIGECILQGQCAISDTKYKSGKHVFDFTTPGSTLVINRKY